MIGLYSTSALSEIFDLRSRLLKLLANQTADSLVLLATKKKKLEYETK